MLRKMRAICYVLLMIFLTMTAAAGDQTLPEDAIVKFDPTNQTIVFLKGENLSLSLEKSSIFRHLLLSDQFGEIAMSFLETYRSFFKILNPREELIIISINKDDLDYKHVRLSQVYTRIPVWGTELIVHLDKDNHVYLANGHYIATPIGLKIQPTLSKQEVKKIAANELSEAKSQCNDCQVGLVIFNSAIDKPKLAYQVFASVSLVEAWEIIVDANTGMILKKLPTIYTR